MVRSIGAQIGLLAFAVAIIAGLSVGNSPTTILIRALLIMLAACVLGQLVGWTGKLVLRDHLQKKKLEIDRAHREAIRAQKEQEEEEPSETAETPDTATPSEAG